MAVPADDKTLNFQDELSFPILLAARVIKSAQEAESSKQECSDLAMQVERISNMLRSTVRLAAVSTHPLYERPVRRIVADVAKNLERALTLIRKCKHSGVLRQVFSITTAADFRKVSNLLESSIGDMKWLLSIFDSDGTNLSLPPIASNDPILAWVWSYIATIQMGQLKDRTDAANELASLARDNDRNKKMIVEEGGIAPLLKLLKEGASAEAQIAAATALSNIATDKERVISIVQNPGVPIIVHVLGDSSTRVQIPVANLVARMAELFPEAQEEFARENATRPLVSTLSMGAVLDDPKLHLGKTTFHSLVQINKELTKNGKAPSINDHNNSSSLLGRSHSSSTHYDGSSRGGPQRWTAGGRDTPSPEVKRTEEGACAEALWKLAKGSLVNSKKIAETKGLLCLAKIIEVERGDLQLNCLMTVMEIAAVAASNSDLRRAAFKTNSPPAKAVFDQLLRVTQEGSSPRLQVPAIRAIGYLARTFPASWERRIIRPLVVQLGNNNVDVATEAAVALGKFVSPENFNCVEHSKAVIEFDGIPPLMKLLEIQEQGPRMHGVVLLCYLALHVSNNKALEQAEALKALEDAARPVVAQNPGLRDLFAKAIHQLTVYQDAAYPHRQPSAT